ncbi:U3 small nucleolar RNA-associated protein [Rickenella mellea]|uniref:U3 small nucleolar RNA-associated protein n=1 Tax=Rickenella mellea TaxID=50990 RepID=A0A4Y7QK90_9AGAM|nr:U3 small nucleolar RNA-associated protein [Rickenella mellea]
MSNPGGSKLKTLFRKDRIIAPLHTGGPIAVTPDGLSIVTCVDDEAILTRLGDGEEICRFVADGETIHSLCLTPSSAHLVLFTASLALHVFNIPSAEDSMSKKIRAARTTPRAHEAPIHVCKVDPNSKYLASGSADGVVKVFDLIHGHFTHSFKGHGGVVSALAFNFHPDPSTLQSNPAALQLITASVDTRIRIFDLSANASRSSGWNPVAVLEGHVSVPRGLDVTPDGGWLVSGGRDSVVLIWDLTERQTVGTKSKGIAQLHPKLVKTIPVLDRVEALGIMHENEKLGGNVVSSSTLRFFTGGGKGVIQIWDGQDGSLLSTIGREGHLTDEECRQEIVNAIYIPSISTIISAHSDHNILFHSLNTGSISRQLVGFNDEIVDVSFLSPSATDSHLAIAANSSLIRIYTLAENDSRLLSGHSGIVLCLARGVGGRVLASGAKDKTARLWTYSSVSRMWRSVAICEGHAESVGAVALSQNILTGDTDEDRAKFMFTGSQDRTIKMWDLSTVSLAATSGPPTQVTHRCRSLTTHKAHEKDINSLDVSPNDRLLASGSQDRTAKIYQIEYHTNLSGSVRGEIKLLGICKGHKRGVWTVRFGKAERVLATGSGDKTIKLWSLDDFTCVKTFEGHANSVLRVDFINQGMQLVSTASDGLLKLWNVRDEECIATMDNHEDKIWALAVSTDESAIVTGAADSVITFWRDFTEEKRLEDTKKRTDAVQKQQDFMNYLSLHDYRNAILLALAMDQPGRLLSLFQDVCASVVAPRSNCGSGMSSVTGNVDVDDALRALQTHELAKLLKHVRDWNTRATTNSIAQTVLHALLKLRSSNDLALAYASTQPVPKPVLSDDIPSNSSEDIAGLGNIIQALIPYTERHLTRVDRLIQESYVLDYLLGEMDDGMFSEELDHDNRMEISPTHPMTA